MCQLGLTPVTDRTLRAASFLVFRQPRAPRCCCVLLTDTHASAPSQHTTQVSRDPSKPTRVAPLPHMFVVRDLVVDMSNFYSQYKSIQPFLKKKG